MTSIELTASETAILFVLMAEGRDVANTELKAYGPELTKPAREKLNRAGLVQSQLIARRYLHSLTDDGWAWCAANLGADAPARSTPLSRALFTVLQGLDRGLRGGDGLISEVFAPRGSAEPPVPSSPTVPSTPAVASSQAADAAPDSDRLDDVEDRIRAAYRQLTPFPGGWVGLLELRARLSDLSRADVDRGLQAIQRVTGIAVIPEENQKTLTPDDRAAAIAIGGQPCHLIAIQEA